MIEERLKEIIVECSEGVDINTINEQTNVITDLNFNSVDLIQFIVEVEENFDIEIDNDNLDKDKVVIVGELAKIIAELKG